MGILFVLWCCWALLASLHTDTFGYSSPMFDENGYLVYCPCMGRFGNQADHFLGVLAFARELDRTLILPPWVEFPYRKPLSTMVPFDRYFDVDTLQEYHRVITMERFMKEIAPTLWPPEKRIVFCYGSRATSSGGKAGCSAKEGNPHGPFWDYSDIDFVDSEFYGQTIGSRAYSVEAASLWTERYPPERYPVLAFSGAPAAFPVRETDRRLHRFLKWSPAVEEKADQFIKDTAKGARFVAIHLRNNVDWDNVCRMVEDGSAGRHVFASPQCLGADNEHGALTMELCKPSPQTIAKQLEKAVWKYKAKAVLVASDLDPMVDRLNKALRDVGAKVYEMPSDAHVSLAIMGKASYYIGNCVSSFSAFAKRERDAKRLPSGFWGFREPPKVKDNRTHDPKEL